MGDEALLTANAGKSLKTFLQIWAIDPLVKLWTELTPMETMSHPIAGGLTHLHSDAIDEMLFGMR